MKNNKSIYIVGIFMLVTMVSIGYAILTGQLNINGSAKISAAKWDIYFKNVKVKDGSVTASVKPSITDKTTVNFEVDLNKPGDFYEFNVDVVNDGMIDAMIESISITPELTVNQQKYLSYSVTYFDDVPLEVKDILHAQKSRTLKVRVEYLKSVENSELNSSDETLNIKATIKYVQADSIAKEPLSEEGEIVKALTLVTGDGTNVGDEIKIGNEHFYVMSNDGTDVILLSKYNLNATSTYDSSITYKQNTDTTASPVQFANYNELTGTAGMYVYDDRSSISQYVNNYEVYLESLDVEIKEIRLIKKEELIDLGCNNTYRYCDDAPSWVRATTYWTGTFAGYYSMWFINSGGNIANNTSYFEATCGIRPVIVVSADAI